MQNSPLSSIMAKKNREKDIERAIRLTWGSLESHLLWTHRKSSEGQKFHKRCVKDYAETLKILAELL